MHLQGERAHALSIHRYRMLLVIPHWKLKIHTWNRSTKEALTSKLV